MELHLCGRDTVMCVTRQPGGCRPIASLRVTPRSLDCCVQAAVCGGAAAAYRCALRSLQQAFAVGHLSYDCSLAGVHACSAARRYNPAWCCLAGVVLCHVTTFHSLQHLPQESVQCRFDLSSNGRQTSYLQFFRHVVVGVSEECSMGVLHCFFVCVCFPFVVLGPF